MNSFTRDTRQLIDRYRNGSQRVSKLIDAVAFRHIHSARKLISALGLTLGGRSSRQKHAGKGTLFGTSCRAQISSSARKQSVSGECIIGDMTDVTQILSQIDEGDAAQRLSSFYRWSMKNFVNLLPPDSLRRSRGKRFKPPPLFMKRIFD